MKIENADAGEDWTDLLKLRQQYDEERARLRRENATMRRQLGREPKAMAAGR